MSPKRPTVDDFRNRTRANARRAELLARETDSIVDISTIRPDENQPRRHLVEEGIEDLAESIRRVGLINPIIIDARGTIIAGERRYLACKLAGEQYVPVRVLEPKHDRLEVSLIENIQRENLHPLDEAMAFAEILQQGNVSQEDLGNRVGKSNVYVSHTLGLLRLADDIKAEWLLNPTTASKYVMIELSRLDEIEQRKAWENLKRKAAGDAAQQPAAKRSGSAKAPPPKTVFSRIDKLGEFCDGVDTSRWRPRTKEDLRRRVEATMEKLQTILESL